MNTPVTMVAPSTSRLPSRNRHPATRSAKSRRTPPECSAPATTVDSISPARGEMANESTAAARLVPAVMKSAAELTPSRYTSKPPTPGPISISTAESDSRTPTSRSSAPGFPPPSSATRGSIVSRAVMPGMSPNAPITPSTMNHVRFKPHSASTTGSAATDPADSTSLMIDTVRRLTRSTRTPANTPTTAATPAVTEARIPAARMSPVFASTSRGNSTEAMPFPSRDRLYDPR